MRVQCGKLKAKYLECVNTVNNIWKVRWDFQRNEFGYQFEEKSFTHKPSLDQIKDVIHDWYNKQTDKAILSGFVWRDMPVWLSTENQFNYKAAYDLAIQTYGTSLPVKFKFGTPDNPIYYTFTDLNTFSDFYISAMKYINTTLDEGWQKKDNINWDNYK